MRTRSAVIVVIALSSAGSAAFAGADAGKGWKLEHFNPHTGKWNVYLSKQGVALVNPRMECTVVSKSPEWNVVVYNDKTKVYFMSPLKDLHFQDQLKSGAKSDALSQSATSFAEKPPKKIRDETIVVPHGKYKGAFYMTDNVAQTGMKKFEFCMTKEVQAPDQFKILFEKMFQVKMANLKGYPLKVAYIDENGKHTPVLDVKDIAPEKVNMAAFSYPDTYKRVDSELAVFMDEKGREAMDTIMNDLGEADGDDEVSKLLDDGGSKKTSESGDTSSSSETTAGEESNDLILFGGIGLAIAAVLGGFAWFFFKSGQPKK